MPIVIQIKGKNSIESLDPHQIKKSTENNSKYLMRRSLSSPSILVERGAVKPLILSSCEQNPQPNSTLQNIYNKIEYLLDNIRIYNYPYPAIPERHILKENNKRELYDFLIDKINFQDPSSFSFVDHCLDFLISQITFILDIRAFKLMLGLISDARWPKIVGTKGLDYYLQTMKENKSEIKLYESDSEYGAISLITKRLFPQSDQNPNFLKSLQELAEIDAPIFPIDILEKTLSYFHFIPETYKKLYYIPTLTFNGPIHHQTRIKACYLIYINLPVEMQTQENKRRLFSSVSSGKFKNHPANSGCLLSVFEGFLSQPELTQDNRTRIAELYFNHYKALEPLTSLSFRTFRHYLKGKGILGKYLEIYQRLEEQGYNLPKFLNKIEEHKYSYRRENFIFALIYLPIEIQTSSFIKMSDEGDIQEVCAYLQLIESSDHPDFFTHLFEYFILKSGFTLEEVKRQWALMLRQPDPEAVYHLHDFLARFIDTHLFPLDDEFTDELILTGIRLSQQGDEQNPYKIYKDLLEKKEASLVLPKPPKEVLNSEHLSLNPFFLRDKLQELLITPADLPHYSRLEKIKMRIEYFISQESNADFQKAVLTEIGMDWNQIKEMALEGNYLLGHLEFEKRTDNRPLSPVSAKFSRILDFIHHFSNEKSEGQLLSIQDIEFLKFLINIAGCPYGKDGGIEAYYNNILPLNYHLKNSAEKVSKGEAVILSSIISSIEGFLTEGNSLFYKRLCGLHEQDEVMQSVHQTIYFKNLIGPYIGIKKSPSFDPHTQVLYIPLLELSNYEALLRFYQAFRPSFILNQITNKLNEALAAPKSKVYTQIRKAFPKLNPEKTWTIDYKKGVTQIKEKGVKEILLTINMLEKN